MAKVESGVQLVRRANQRHSLSGINSKLFGTEEPRQNQIIEIIGDFSEDLLIDFIIRCALPSEVHEAWKGSGVILVNTAHHLGVLRIAGVMNAHLKHLKVKSTQPIIEQALKNIRILDCYDNEQMKITIRGLEKMITDRDNVSLLVFDDIFSHYWVEKQIDPTIGFDAYCKRNLALLQIITKNTNVVLGFSSTSPNNETCMPHVDYKICGEVRDEKSQFIVINYTNEIPKRVPFTLETFIQFSS